jgi:hypothetical protein
MGSISSSSPSVELDGLSTAYGMAVLVLHGPSVVQRGNAILDVS